MPANALPQILDELQAFVLRPHSDTELLALREGFAGYSEEEFLVATLEKCPTESEVRDVTVRDCGEKFIELDPEEFKILPSGLSVQTSGNSIFVRSGIAEKMLRANARLRIENPNFKLSVKCGYRELWPQTVGYLAAMEEAETALSAYSPKIQEAFASLSVASPVIAAHPTGGAVDVGIWNSATGRELDFWVPSFPGDSLQDRDSMFLNWKNLSLEAIKNRLLLARTMVSEGFWLFPGEFWHFSTGDAESAAALGMRESKYAQIARFADLPR